MTASILGLARRGGLTITAAAPAAMAARLRSMQTWRPAAMVPATTGTRAGGGGDGGSAALDADLEPVGHGSSDYGNAAGGVREDRPQDESPLAVVEAGRLARHAERREPIHPGADVEIDDAPEARQVNVALRVEGRGDDGEDSGQIRERLFGHCGCAPAVFVDA